MARKTWIPVSALAAYTAGVKFEQELPLVSDWQFLDIKTDANGFRLVVLNDEIFTNARELVDATLSNRDLGQRVVCSFNGFRFHNLVLGKLGLLPSIRFGSYTAHYFPGMLNNQPRVVCESTPPPKIFRVRIGIGGRRELRVQEVPHFPVGKIDRFRTEHPPLLGE